MLTKPLIFLLTFTLTIVNFIILLLPLALIFSPIIFLYKSYLLSISLDIIFFLISIISSFMLFYIALDFIFGFAVRYFNKNAIPFSKMQMIHAHQEIQESFDWLKKKFDLPNAELYVGNNLNEVNAFAVGSMRKKSVIITMGLIQSIHEKAENDTQYIDAVKAILGHEMSHLKNKDYLPGLLTHANESINNTILSTIKFIFNIILLLRFLPFIGSWIYLIFFKTYQAIQSATNLFFYKIFMPLHNFFLKWLGRSIEYRCDKESAYAFGGRRMATGLSMIGAGSYFSIFSTHPRTKSRIDYVKDIQPLSGVIKPNILSSAADILSLLIVAGTFYYSFNKIDFSNFKTSQTGQIELKIPDFNFTKYKDMIMNLYYENIDKF